MKLRLTRRRAIALAGAALASPARAAAPSALRYVPQAPLASIDPLLNPSRPTAEAAAMLFDMLYGLDRDLVPQPQMAEGHTLSEDLKTWRITLREGLFFHDGSRVTARDAVASLRRWMQHGTNGLALADRLADLRPVDDRTLEIRLRKPFSLLPYVLARGADCVIRPEHVLRNAAPGAEIRDPTGSGPFILDAKSFTPGAPAAFRRNPRYTPRDEPCSLWAGGKRVRIDRVEWTPLADAEAGEAMRQGRIDWWGAPPLGVIADLARVRGIRTAQYDPFGAYTLLLFNPKEPPFDARALRAAAIPALEQAVFMGEVVGSKRALMNTGIGVFAPQSPVASTIDLLDLTEPRNPAAARQAVRESGYSGTPAILLTTESGPNATLGRTTQALYEDLGLNVAAHTVPPATLATSPAPHLPKDGWSFACLEYEAWRTLDPGTHPMLDPGYADDRLTALRAAWFDASDLAARRRVADQIQTHVLAAPGFLPLGQYFTPTALRLLWTDVVTCSVSVFWNLYWV